MRDEALEKAIDEAGRDKVFALAQANGWAAGSTPPKWVWWALVREAQKQKSPSDAA